MTNITAPTFNAPGIASASVLIDLSISVWTGRKKDKRASENVTATAGALTGVAGVIKKLLGDCAELDAVQKFAANVRNAHYSMTTPWSDLGMRLCPTVKYINGYELAMSEYQQEFWVLVEKFLTSYEWEIQNAQLKLGSLFNPDEYPTTSALRDKFKFRYAAMPMPTVGDWRLDVEAEAAASLKAQYESFFNEQYKKSMEDVWRRVHETITRMSEKLDYRGDEDKKIFRDSLVSNVHEMITMLRDFNVTGDPVMARAAKELDAALEGVTPEALREDAYLRAQTKRTVDEVRKTIDGLGLGW
jgi:hypothetical protein